MKIGIDLGGTNTVVGICTDDGALLLKSSLPTPHGNADELCKIMRQLALEVCEKSHTVPADVLQIGIGAPGTFDKSACTLTFGTNLGMSNVCFAHAFAPDFTCPVYLDNDGNCAALGEYISGSGRGGDNMIMVTLGTGVGGGIILNGKLYTGFNHIAGEIGHMVIVYDGLPCNCGRKGCFETYCSATGLIRSADRALENHVDSILHQRKLENNGRLNAKIICDACDAGDTLAMELFHTYLQYLACGINNLINIFQPQKIVFGGGVAGYGEKLLAPLRELVQKELISAPCGQAELVKASLGNDAGIIGAAMLLE